MITQTASTMPRTAVIIQDDEAACLEARWLQHCFGPALTVYLFASVDQALPTLTNTTLGLDLVLYDVSGTTGETMWDALHALASALAQRFILLVPLLSATSDDPTKYLPCPSAQFPAPYLMKGTPREAFCTQVSTLWQRWQTLRSALATVRVLEEPPGG